MKVVEAKSSAIFFQNMCLQAAGLSEVTNCLKESFLNFIALSNLHCTCMRKVADFSKQSGMTVLQAQVFQKSPFGDFLL